MQALMWFAIFVVGYWLVPDLLGHHLQLGGFFGNTYEQQVALTFDDGPGEDTPFVLGQLEKAGVKATFFLVAERAEQHPELVREMVAAGHEVALHGWHHQSAWLLSPWATAREILRGRALLTNLAGRPPRFYRPPWGHHNLVTWVLPGLVGMRRVLWTVAPDDWRPDKNVADLIHYVEQYALPGSIVVMHDGGGDRRRTAAALPAMVEGLRARALTPVVVGAMEEEHSWLRRAWFWWEGVFTRMGDVDTIPAGDGDPPSLRVGRAAYKGPELNDGSMVIRPGAPMLEIHLQNVTLGAESKGRAGGLRALTRMLRSLNDVAHLLATSPKYQDVEIVGGVTVLDMATAIQRAGLERVEMRGAYMFFMRLYLVLLMAVFHNQGFAVLKRLPKLKPVLVYLPRERFLVLYGTAKGARRGKRQPPA